jgi:hypothetical protein
MPMQMRKMIHHMTLLRENVPIVILGIRLYGGEIQMVHNCVTLVEYIGDFEGRIGHYHSGVIESNLERKKRYHFNTDLLDLRPV